MVGQQSAMRTSFDAVGTIDARPTTTDAGVVIDQNELRSAFQAAAGEMPDDLELLGVTYHGEAHQEWVAIAGENGDPNVSCEGWGDSPIDALKDLVRHVREDACGRRS
jgi:hypothetical protein